MPWSEKEIKNLLENTAAIADELMYIRQAIEKME